MLFKKNKAITIDKMNVLQDIVINEDKVKFNVQYSNTTLDLKQIPKLLSDVMQLYAVVKPMLDQVALNEAKDKVKTLEDSTSDDVEALDLSEIPF